MLQKISVSKKFLLIFLFNQETRRTQRFLKDEDWNNYAENSAGIYSQLYSHRKKAILNCDNISQYPCFYCIFDQINAALSTKDFLIYIECIHLLLSGFITTNNSDFSHFI